MLSPEALADEAVQKARAGHLLHSLRMLMAAIEDEWDGILPEMPEGIEEAMEYAHLTIQQDKKTFGED